MSLAESLDDREFSINVTEHLKVESSTCFHIYHELTFPKNKVKVPYKKMLFERDPSTIIATKTVSKVDSETRDNFWINGLPRGEYEYGFKLEWGCNQTYIFPKKVHISVSGE